ncbi:MAG: shikimate dehydrogenase [Phycisphaeraceae bacterium]
MTRIAVSIMVRQLEQALADSARAAEFGAELVEFRLDAFADEPTTVTALVERSALPCIVTCRPLWEGGEFAGDDATRLALLSHACRGTRQPAYLDVELAAWRSSPLVQRHVASLVAEPGGPGPGLILSSHDFVRRPAQLYQRLEAMVDADACRAMKVAWHARSVRDSLEAFEILMQRYKPAIALCMGEFGLASRVLAKKFGALLTFAALDKASATAPGQPTLAELKDLYRWDSLNRRTKVHGVIGWPVAHSLSPAIHNAGFEAIGYDGVYLPMPIPPEYEHFKASVGAWLDFEPADFAGASVTIPHKEHLIRFVRERGGEIEPLADLIGAANTLLRREDGSLLATNTDYAAALDAVCHRLGIGRDELGGRNVAVLGAGGAARAIVAGFAHCGANVIVYNRTLERAEALADQVRETDTAAGELAGKVLAQRMETLAKSCCDVLINCTPIGMHPEVDASPVDDEAWPRGCGERAVVFDTIYNPAKTKLLEQAEARGCVTIGGREMFVRQAAAQFELWTRQAPPLDVFRAVMARS